MADLPRARYGHACLLMEWAGAEGVLVSGGALTRDNHSSNHTNLILYIYSKRNNRNLYTFRWRQSK